VAFATGSEVLWLNLTNIALGVVVLICFVAIAVCAIHEGPTLRRKRAAVSAELDADMKKWFADDRTFHVPELGITMADGGERVDNPEQEQ
jgi:hypothetical protein